MFYEKEVYLLAGKIILDLYVVEPCPAAVSSLSNEIVVMCS